MNALLKVMKMFNKIWPRNGGGDWIQHPDHGGFLDVLMEAQPHIPVPDKWEGWV